MYSTFYGGKSENKKGSLKQMSFDFTDDMFVMLPGGMLSR